MEPRPMWSAVNCKLRLAKWSVHVRRATIHWLESCGKID